MSQLLEKFNYLKRRKSFKYGLPFLIMMVGGSFGLKYFTSLRYEYARKQPVTPEDMEEIGVKMKKHTEVTLETEFEKIQKIDIDHWENKRGPRPWEEVDQK